MRRPPPPFRRATTSHLNEMKFYNKTTFLFPYKLKKKGGTKFKKKAIFETKVSGKIGRSFSEDDPELAELILEEADEDGHLLGSELIGPGKDRTGGRFEQTDILVVAHCLFFFLFLGLVEMETLD